MMEVGLEEDSPQHIVCNDALSACQELMKTLSDDDKKVIISSLLDTLPHDELIFTATSLFGKILAKRDPNLEDYMPKDFIEKAAITTYTLATLGKSNILYDLVRGLSCSRHESQHLPLHKLPYCVVALILSSLFGNGAETFHSSDDGKLLASWLNDSCSVANADHFLSQMNKLLFPWDHVQYKMVTENHQSRLILNIHGEFKSVFEHNDELGGIIESMTLESQEKELELLVCEEVQDTDIDIEEDDEFEEEEEDEFADLGHVTELDESLLSTVETLDRVEEHMREKANNEVFNEELNNESQASVNVLNKEQMKFACYLCPDTFTEKEALMEHTASVHYVQEDGTFKCPECQQKFTTYDEFSAHELTHVFKCDECEKIFTRKRQLDNHMELHEEKQTECPVCCEFFPSRAAMLLHRASTHTVQKNFSCQYCERKFPQMRNLRYHMVTVHTDKPMLHYCTKCSKSFLVPDNLNRHIEKVHANNSPLLKCDLCQKSFRKQLALEYHKKKSHGIESENLLNCPVPNCDKQFGTKVSLIRHKAKHQMQGKGNPVYQCEVCQKTFIKKSLLTEHKLTNHPDHKESYPCSVCKQDFPNITRKTRHEKMIHGLIKTHTCTQCPQGFTDRYALERHLKVHEGVRDFQCGQCGNTFYTAHHLRRHIMHVHEGKPTRRTKPERVKCDQCEKTFGEKRFLFRHQQREHFGKMDYDQEICQICNRTFSGKSSLTRHHRRIHKGIKDHTTRDFQCDICAKTFVFKQSLQRHMQSVHKQHIFDFECDVCHKRFANDSNLRKHQANHSGENSCKPRKKRPKVFNIPQLLQGVSLQGLKDYSIPTEETDEKPHFIEIQVVEGGQSDGLVQGYDAATSWAIQQDEAMEAIAAAGDAGIPQQYILSEAVDRIEDETHTATVLPQIELVTDGSEQQQSFVFQPEVEDTNRGMILTTTNPVKESWNDMAPVSGSEIVAASGVQGEIVQVPAGVKYIRLGGKLVKLADGMILK